MMGVADSILGATDKVDAELTGGTPLSLSSTLIPALLSLGHVNVPLILKIVGLGLITTDVVLKLCTTNMELVS